MMFIRKYALFFSFALGLLISSGLGSKIEAANAGEAASAAKPAPAGTLSVYDKLREPVECKFDNVPLRDAMRELSEKVGVPIVFDERALKEAGIEPDFELNSSLSGITLRNVLQIILSQLHLDWITTDEAISITTDAKARAAFDVRIYPAGELFARGFANNAEGSGNHNLQKVITGMAPASSWIQSGGSGVVSWVPNGLLIKQTRDVHDNIETLFADLKHVVLQDGTPQSASSRIHEALLQKTALNLKNVSLRDLAAMIDMNLYIDTKSLGDAGIDPDKLTFSGRYDGISLQSALNLIFEPANIDYLVKDGVIKIASRADADKRFVTRVYNVESLVTDSFSPASVAWLIQWTIAPRTWRDPSSDGSPSRPENPADLPLGAVFPLPGCLVVNHTHRVQREIAALLENLERNKAAGQKPPKPFKQPEFVR